MGGSEERLNDAITLFVCLPVCLSSSMFPVCFFLRFYMYECMLCVYVVYVVYVCMLCMYRFLMYVQVVCHSVLTVCISFCM